MAGERKITVQFDGEDVGLASAADKAASDLDGLEQATDGVAKKSMTAAEKMTALIGVASGGAIAYMGFRDAQEGVQAAFQGDFSQIDKVIQGMEGMGSGMALLIASIPEQVTTWVVGHATMAASALAGIGSQIVEWATLAASSLASAAAVAASWFLAVWPVALVIAIVVALVIVIIKNWDTIKRVIEAGWRWVAKVTDEVWEGIKGLIGKAWGAIHDTIQSQIDIALGLLRGIKDGAVSALSALADALLAPWKTAFSGIRTLWNNTVGGFGFKVPDWIPIVGGKGFNIPKMAAGGIVTSPTLALIGEAGPEAVVPLGRGGVGGMVHLHITSAGSRLDDVLVDVLRKAITNRGGLQATFG